jgi:hypothetical protein
MRKSTEDKEFTIQITYTPKELNEISKWYINTVMPPIYKNYDLNNEENADMIEDEAVSALMKIGSNQVMTEYLHENIIIFTPDEAEEFIDDLLTEEE